MLIGLSLTCILVIAIPGIGVFLARFFGVTRGTDLLLFFSFILGLIAGLAIHVKIRNLDRDITNLVRYIAIANADNKK
jgi:hypothetical protein